MVTLRYHIDRMGLEASGHLKGDLQQCLCEAVRGGHSGTGGHAPKRTVAVKKKGSGSGGDGDGDDDEPDEESGRGRGRRASQGDSRGRRKRADQKEVDKSPVPVLPPDRVRFHNIAVSTMSPEERREALQELDMASLRKDDDEIIHDLIDALVLRKAEAADMQSRKQAWRGRSVYMMRKAELADMLRDFELDDTGKVEEMRTRFRKALRKWAAEEIKLPTSGAGGSGGASAGAGAGASDSEEEQDKTEAGSDAGDSSTDGAASGRRRGRSTRHTRSKDDAAGASQPKPRPSRASRKSPSKKVVEEARSASASRRGRRRSSISTTVGSGEGSTNTRNTRSRRRPGDEQVVLSPKRAASPKTLGKGLLSG